MDHEKKLAFVHKMTKTALDHVEHLDAGGGVFSPLSFASSGTQSITNPAGLLQGGASDLTAKNGYVAGAPTSVGTVGQQQADLAAQLQIEAAGNGPNPAQLKLQQNAQKLAQQRAAENASNRALNPGLAARMSGNIAANAGQEAAGSAGVQQAEQQIAAQQQLQGLVGQEQHGALGAESINANTAGQNAAAVNSTLGGILGGAGSVLSMLNKGGKVKKMADGGDITVPSVPSYESANEMSTPIDVAASSQSGQKSGKSAGSSVGKFMNKGSESTSSSYDASNPDAYASPDAMEMNNEGFALDRFGGPVVAAKGEKAVMPGDNKKNDKIPTMLSEGELVIDRETMADPGPAGQMARALAKYIKAKNGKKK